MEIVNENDAIQLSTLPVNITQTAAQDMSNVYSSSVSNKLEDESVSVDNFYCYSIRLCGFTHFMTVLEILP